MDDFDDFDDILDSPFDDDGDPVEANDEEYAEEEATEILWMK